MVKKKEKSQMNLTIVALVAVVAIVGLVVLALNSVKSSSVGTKSFSTQTLSATEEEIQDLRLLNELLLEEAGVFEDEEGNLAGEGIRRKQTLGRIRTGGKGDDVAGLGSQQELHKPVESAGNSGGDACARQTDRFSGYSSYQQCMCEGSGSVSERNRCCLYTPGDC